MKMGRASIFWSLVILATPPLASSHLLPSDFEEFEYSQHMEQLDSLADSCDFEDLTHTETDLFHLSNISDFKSLDQAPLIDLIGDDEEFEKLDQELFDLLDNLGMVLELGDEVVKCN